MAKDKNTLDDAVVRTAETVGSALGSVAGTIDSLQAKHPHPVEEAREALAAGQKTVTAAAAKVGTRASAKIKKAKTVVRRTKTAATRARRKSKPAAARATRGAKKLATRARNAVKRGRKAAKRAVKRGQKR